MKSHPAVKKNLYNPASEQVKVTCPYCCQVEPVALPPTVWFKAGIAHEVQCLPYTRDVGKFDNKGWTQVGKDYLDEISWERIGILRQEPKKEFKVAYKVQTCCNCRKLYDVFLNGTAGNKFAQLWPHLFAADDQDPGNLQTYTGVSWPIWSIRKLALAFGSPGAASAGIGILVLLLGMLPWFFFDPASTGNANYLLVIYPDLISKLIASAGIIMVLLLLERFVSFLQNEADFEALFSVTEDRGVRFYRNYTLCRFVGVQTKGHLPQLSQVEIVGGGAAVVSLWVTWLFAHFLWKESLPIAINNGWEVGKMIADFFFWTTFAFCAGIAAWVSMSSALYVLKGLERIAMNLSPFNQFEQMTPLLTIRRFSSIMMGVLFIALIGIVSIILVFPQIFQQILDPRMFNRDIGWLSLWMQFALSIMFAAIAIGVRRRFIAIVVVFVALEFAIFIFIQQPVRIQIPAIQVGIIHLNAISILVDYSVLVLGGFLTFINIFHGRASMAVIKGLMKAAKLKTLREIDHQMEELRRMIDGKITVQDHLSVTDKTNLMEYTQALQGLEALIGLRKEVVKVEDRPKPFVLSQVFPFILSFILPTLMDEGLMLIIKTMIPGLKDLL